MAQIGSDAEEKTKKTKTKKGRSAVYQNIKKVHPLFACYGLCSVE